MDIIQLIKDIVTIVATVAGAIIAGYGVDTWRKQLKGKTEYELARRLLKAVYKLREAIKIVRNPFIPSGEVYQALIDEGFSKEEIEKDETKILSRQDLVYKRRWEHISEANSNLKVEILEAEVIWGEEIKELTDELRKCISLLNLNLTRYQRQQNNTRDYSRERMEEIEKVIWDDGDPDENFFTNRIETAISEIENFLKPHLKL